MNPQETQQVAARDEKWVPFSERVKISSTNVRLETTVPQKEETFQVWFWYSIKKVQGTNSYEFLLANKKCVVNAEVFRTILNICLRVEGVDFTDVPDDDTALTFFIKLGYKGLLENVDYPKLIWEHLAYQIDHRKEKRSRRKDYQEYRLSIPKTMLTEAIKQSESYQMFIKYSTGQIPPKKSRGKGSQRKKTADDSQETIDVSEEFKPEPVKRKTFSKRRVKTKVTMYADDNIIFDDPDTALELGKSISKTKAQEAEAARQVYVTYARIVTKSVPEPTKRRKSGKVTSDPPKKLKGVPSLTPEEQEAIYIMQALKESKKTRKRQLCTGGSSKGTCTIPGVPDESTVVSAISSEELWGSEQESEYSEEDKLDDEDKDDKEGDANDEAC
ncbi:hypothetical protein Tco_1366868 [Tanacetum coccineum]